MAAAKYKRACKAHERYCDEWHSKMACLLEALETITDAIVIRDDLDIPKGWPALTQIIMEQIDQHMMSFDPRVRGEQ